MTILSLDIQLKQGLFNLEARFAMEAPVTGLFGSSGAGKSTLLNVVAGLAHPQKGWLKLGAKRVFDSENRINLPPDKRDVGLVFQDSQLFPHLSVKRNLLYGYNRTSTQRRRFNLHEIVDLLEIGHLLKSRPTQLSGGERQRVGLGRALLASPRLLLLDEPLASLDFGLKEQILPFLKRVKDELALPMVYISHSIDEILHLTDELVVINEGRILGAGHFYDVIKDTGVQRVAKTMGLENVVPVKIDRHDTQFGHTVAELNGSTLLLPFSSVPCGDTCYVSVRSTEIALAKQPVKGISIQNQIKGRILQQSGSISRVMLFVDIGVPLLVDVTPKAYADLALSEGDDVYCLIKAQSFHYLGQRGNTR